MHLSWLQKLVDVRPNEVRALLWSFAYFFSVLCAYYILRPMRDEMGIIGGTRNLPWLFTATFVTLLAAIPFYGLVVAKLPRRRFIPIVYRFFIANILIFWLLLQLDVGKELTARVFFVWISVFNLFVVSVLWWFIAYMFRNEQGKRLFGFIAAGGSAGVLLGPSLTIGLAKPLGAVNLLLISALILEIAVFCMRRVDRENTGQARDTAPTTESADGPPNEAIGGGVLSGILLIMRSSYLSGIALWVALLSLAGTFLYFEQQHIVAAVSDDSTQRLRIFASIDLAVGILTILIQLAATGRIISRFGVGLAAAILPLVAIIGFSALAIAPLLLTIIIFQACQRTANFAISNPAREIFFTVVDREEKYKAKNVVDTVVFRGGDAASGWAYAALQGLGLQVAGIAMATIPIAALWFGLSLWLGRAQTRRAALPHNEQPPI
jgi:AAA family ATP:ADP antiporter